MKGGGPTHTRSVVEGLTYRHSAPALSERAGGPKSNVRPRLPPRGGRRRNPCRLVTLLITHFENTSRKIVFISSISLLLRCPKGPVLGPGRVSMSPDLHHSKELWNFLLLQKTLKPNRKTQDSEVVRISTTPRVNGSRGSREGIYTTIVPLVPQSSLYYYNRGVDTALGLSSYKVCLNCPPLIQMQK